MFLNKVIDPFVMRIQKKPKKRAAHEFSRPTKAAVTAFHYFQNMLEEMAVKCFVAL